MHVHDGPGMNSDQVNHNSSVIQLSSFQAFIVLFTKKPWNYEQDVPNTEFGLSYFGRKVKAIEIHVPKSQIVRLPPCTTNAEIYQKPSSSNKLCNKMGHSGNQYCVYNITSGRRYVNLTITKLTYVGYNFDDLLPKSKSSDHCHQGGVALITAPKMHNLCNNYASNPAMEEKSLMGIVTQLMA